jgi:PHAX RNA-binding domain
MLAMKERNEATTPDTTQQKQKEAPNEQHNKLVALIAEGLGEKPFTYAYKQIDTAVKILGGFAVLQLAQEALEIEKQGGMMTQDGKRRRTLGGIFFHIMKGRLTSAQRRRIFPYRLKVNGSTGAPGKATKGSDN